MRLGVLSNTEMILDYLFQGQIDDVRIFGRALSAAEVNALYRE
jgi:hypothetical protein